MLKFQNKKLNIKYITQKNYFFMLTFFVLSQTGLIKLVWDVVGEDLAKLLGYKELYMIRAKNGPLANIDDFFSVGRVSGNMFIYTLFVLLT